MSVPKMVAKDVATTSAFGEKTLKPGELREVVGTLKRWPHVHVSFDRGRGACYARMMNIHQKYIDYIDDRANHRGGWSKF